MANTPKDFIEKISTYAVAGMKKTNILASLCIAQACLETGFGKSETMMKYNALFGIKATSTWKGKVYSSKTKECYNGVSFTTITDLFRAYDSLEDGISDYFNLLSGSSRYANLIGEKDYVSACRKIKDDGYATDPNYPNKLIKIIEDCNLTAWDCKTNVALSDTSSNDSKYIIIDKTQSDLLAGDTIKILKTAKTYVTGENIPDKYKNIQYTVQQVKIDKVLIKELYSWVYVKDVVKVIF